MRKDIREPFLSAWNEKNIFSEVAGIDGEVFRQKEGRRTLRFQFNNKSYFLKQHQGIGWKEVFKNLFQLRLPIIGASNEYEAAELLSKQGVDTLSTVAFASKGLNPAKQNSFIITHDINNSTSLEDYCRDWPNNPPKRKVKQALIKRVADIARIMHGKGINHRDFYICHFLLENNAEEKINKGENFSCHLIDLHRCQLRQSVPHRWSVKDLGGLLYSSFDTGLSRNDYFRFVKIYTQKSLKDSLADPLWLDVYNNALKLYLRDFGKSPAINFKAAR